jgi:signal transduction histidine kinase/ligand-binding sensor domain-containing protein
MDGVASDSVSAKERRMKVLQFVCVTALLLPLPFHSCYAVERTIAQYQHTAWTVKNGAPTMVFAITQAADGYLWLASFDGLYRFDGVEFQRFEPPRGTRMPSTIVSALYAPPTGGLWMGFRSGAIAFLKEDHFTIYDRRDGLEETTVLGLVEDEPGTIWAAYRDAGLERFAGGRWQHVGEDWGFPGKTAQSLYFDRNGTLWVTTENSVFFLPRGARQFASTGEKVWMVPQIAEDLTGKLWMAESTRSVHPMGFSLEKGTIPEIRVGSRSILFDQAGALWIATEGDGLIRIDHPEGLRNAVTIRDAGLDRYTQADGLTNDFAMAVFEDRERNIWVGTMSGLDEFSQTNLVPVLMPPGYQGFVMVPGDDGDMWIGSSNRPLVEMHAGILKVFKTDFPNIAGFRDGAGVTWMGGDGEILRIVHDRIDVWRSPVPKSNNEEIVVTMAEDSDGYLWVYTQLGHLWRVKNRRWQQVHDPRFVQYPISAMYTDELGRVWFGYQNGQLAVLQNHAFRTYTAAKTIGQVTAITGRNERLWIGGEYGVAYFSNGQMHNLRLDSTPSLLTTGIVETADGALWLAAARGIISISTQEVRKAVNNFSYPVKFRLFDYTDGLPGAIQQSRYSDAVEGTDGRIWFGTTGGPVWIDPAHLLRNSVPPSVLIQSLQSGNTQFPTQLGLQLPVHTTSLQINFTATSLIEPSRVRFQYQLQSVDKGWVDAGTRRQAFFSNLAPGKYRFRVIACNNDGVWNDVGAAMNFSIAPAWYQTDWFRAACAAIGLLLLWGIYCVRVHWLAKSLSARFDERLAERTRVARELHDVFLQSVQASKMIADDALRVGGDPAQMRPTLERVSSWLGQAAEEGRAALNSLRVSTEQRNDLVEALQQAAKECQEAGSMGTSFAVSGNVREMHPAVRYEIYRIGYEAIRNACVHSGGTRMEVRLSYDKDLILSISDNGIGIDAAVSEKGKLGHFGLQGMRERAARIGSKLTIVSSANSGTAVTIIVPGRAIFRKAGSSRLERIRELFPGKNRAGDPQ